MEITLELIVFTVLALFIGVSAILAVTTRRILRAATYLLFVLFGTAGIYFQLNYSFLGAVQLLIYAGGITVLYVFSILLGVVHVLPPVRQCLPDRRDPLLDRFRARRLHARKARQTTQ